jgi:hypothetical protein
MAVTANGRVLAIGGVLLFVGGCWAGMRSETSAETFCVVVPETADAHPGFTPGQFVEEPDDGCLEGEHEVCGVFEGSDENRRFVSDDC